MNRDTILKASDYQSITFNDNYNSTMIITGFNLIIERIDTITMLLITSGADESAINLEYKDSGTLEKDYKALLSIYIESPVTYTETNNITVLYRGVRNNNILDFIKKEN